MLSFFPRDEVGKSDAIFESREEYIVRFFRAMTFYTRARDSVETRRMSDRNTGGAASTEPRGAASTEPTSCEP